MIKFDCDECGKVEKALMDGYAFGDREFEGVMFEVTKNDDKTCNVVALDNHNKPIQNWKDDPYLRKFNSKYWIEEAKEFAARNDIFICSKCDADVVPDDMLENFSAL